MFNTTNIIEALGIGLLVGTVAGAVGAVVFVQASTMRRRRRDRDRLVRMQRYLADAQRGRHELHPNGYSRAPVTFAEVAFDADGLERLARTLVHNSEVVLDPPCSAAGGSLRAPRPQPTLTLVDDELDTEVSR